MQGKSVLLELIKRHKSAKAPLVLDSCFDRQKQVICHPSRFKAARCSRRAGKSEMAGAYLCKTALENPESLNVYLALTRKSAKRIMWRILKRLAKKHRLEVVFKETELVAQFANGAQIILAGANDESTAEDLRGNAYHLVVIDEVASYRGHLDEMIDEILIPALTDYKGTLLLIGTPTSDFTSMFYRATSSPTPEWTAFHWTMHDNPHIEDPDEIIADLKRRKQWSDDNPILLREYYGQWTKNDSELVFRFNPQRNVAATRPQLGEFVLGVDLGFRDACAFVVMGFDRRRPEVFVAHVEKRTGLIPSEIAAIVSGIQERFALTAIVCDEGGLGKSIAEEFRRRYGLPVKPAEKTQKRAYIELMNSDFVDGKIKVPEDSPIIEEWTTILWDELRKLPAEGQEDHLSDAALYAWRECRHYLYEEPPKLPEHNSADYWRKEEEKFIKDAENSLKEQSETPWWEQ